MTQPLPELQNAMIDLETFRRYVDDLQLAEILEVRLKGAEALRAGEDVTDLARGATMFEGQDVGGMQIRYRFEGLEWWDTLMWVGERIRLVRIAHDWASYGVE